MKNDTCKYFKKCGACQLRNMTYEEQLSFKMRKVIKLLGRFGHIDEIVGMEDPSAYRNKAQAMFFGQGGRVFAGIYHSSTGKVMKCDSCPVISDKAGKIIKEIACIMNELRISAYDPERGKGFLRHVLVRHGFASGEIMVVIVSASPAFPKEKQFVSMLTERIPQITTILHNVNDTATPLWLTENERVIYGNGYITDILCSCVFKLSSRSFYQINPLQTEKLYSKAIALASLTGKESVLDAYCGIGTIGLIAAKKAHSVHCVETNRTAVADAVENAKINGIYNAKFYACDTVRFINSAIMRQDKYDVVFMDPPRAGCDKNFLSRLMTLSPKKIIYISCNPETMARDIAYLGGGGYRVRKAVPFDMFPHTNHVEMVVMLSHKREEN